MVIILRSIHRVEKKKNTLRTRKPLKCSNTFFVITVMVFADMFVQREYDL